MRADVSDEAEKDRTGKAEEDVPKRTVIENGSVKPNGIANPRGTLTGGSVQLELPISSNGNERPSAEEERLAERARALVDSLDKLSSEEVFAAFEELDQLPKDVVRAALENATGPAPDPEQLDDAIRRAHGFPPRPLQLRKILVTKDADVFDLGPMAEEQLRLAGKAWDGRDLAPEERLDGEIEDSFAGTLERVVLADAEHPAAPPLFDVLLYAGDAGTIFRAGTTEIVGAIAYGVVEMNDRRSRVAIQEALARPFEPAAAVTHEPEPEEEPELEEARELPLSAAPDVPSSVAPPAQPAEARVPQLEIAPEEPAAPRPPKKTAAGTKKKAAASSKKAAAAKKTAAASKKAAASKAGTSAKTSTSKASSKKATAASKKTAASATKATGSGANSARPAAGAPKKAAAKKAGGSKPSTAKKTTAKKTTKKSGKKSSDD